jgi:hypothetical protein
MLSLLKKKSDAAAAPALPNWHPNFRNFEKLPDTKAVRTAFFVNGVAISIALILATYFAIQEWKLRAIKVQVNDEQRKIDRDKRPSDQAVATFKKFQAEEVRIIEVDTFMRSKPIVSALLTRLGETLPPNIAVDSIDLREAGLVLRFSVRGAPETAPGYATAYRDQLAADKQLAQFEEVNFTTTPTLNPATGQMAVEFMLKLKPPAGGKK